MKAAIGCMILVLLSLPVVACDTSVDPAPDTIATQVAEAVAATLTAAEPSAVRAVAATATLPPSPTVSPQLVPTITGEPPPTPANTATGAPPPTTTRTDTPPPATSPTDTLPEDPTATKPQEAASACPPPGDPPARHRPTFFEEYPAALADYLSKGADATDVERLLRRWEAVTTELGSVESSDMTGDGEAELVVFLVDPSPEGGILQWPPGDVLIFQCEAGKVVPAFLGRFSDDEDWDWYSFHRQKLEDVNDTGLVDLVYVGRTCGAHTCFDRLYVIEWDGAAFVDRTLDMEAYPYPTFVVGQGQIHVDVGGIGSAGAGIQRSHQELWTWDGDRFALSEEVVGSPLTLIHYVHDGDDALARGAYEQAIDKYQQALGITGMDSGLFLGSEEEGRAVVQAYSLFKLMVSYAEAGMIASAETYYQQLLAGHPGGTLGHVYVDLGSAFWSDFLANGDAFRACQEAVAVAEADPLSAELLYAGYANPEYSAARLCDVPQPIAAR